jgi:hypothetical protein
VTFDDVVEVSKQIHAYIKSVKVNLPQDALETEVQVNYSSSNTNEEKNIMSVPSFDREEKDEEKKKYSGGQDRNDDRLLGTKKVEGTIDGEGYITHEQNDGGSDSTPSTEPPDQFRAITQDAFEVNKKHFVDKDDKGNVKYVSQGIDPGQLKDVLIPYEELAKVRKVTPSQKRTAEFLNDIKNSVANMIKEFELRKAAYQFKKATISKTGMLDVDKLHSYKTSEDLFLRSVKLGEFKDHGMVMLVDYSGSMRYTLKSVLKQVLILATFCKKTNIPFDIYGFTKHASWAPDAYKSMYHENVSLHNLKVFQILASSLDKATYRQAFDALVEQAEIKNASNHRDVYYRDNNPIETLGDTPLNESIMVMHDVLRKFKVKYNSQKVIFVTLTDGSATTMSFNSPVPKNAKIKVANKFYDYKPYEFTGTLIKSLKEQGLCDKALSYSLVEHSSYFTSYFNRYTNQQSVSKNNDLEVARKKFKNDGMLAFDNIEGYDRVILIRQNTDFLSGEEEEMDIDSTSTKSQIAKQFKKHAVSKKNGRILAVKFAETVS